MKGWTQIRKQLKAEFERMNITRCEKCGASYPLSFAHRYKRRFITTDTELRKVALLCLKCHETIEHSGHQKMYEAISEIIQKRTGYDITGMPFVTGDEPYFEVHQYFSDDVEEQV